MESQIVILKIQQIILHLNLVGNETNVGYTENCPHGYCLRNTTIITTLPDILCGGNRMEWLRGQCKEGYSIVLWSTDSYQCHYTLHSAFAISFGLLGDIVYMY